MSTEILTAVLSGLVTAVVIEFVRQANERKKALENRQLEHNKQLHAFLEYDDTLRQVRPVARLLISSRSEQIRIPKIPPESQLIECVQEVREKRISINEILEDERNASRGKAPRRAFTIPRTFHRALFDRPSHVQLWTIRERIELLGTVTVIGRSKNSDIQLDTDLVSRLHAIIRFENEHFVFYNLSTSSRILINDQEMPFQKNLQDGDVIEFEGSYLIEFEKKYPISSKTG